MAGALHSGPGTEGAAAAARGLRVRVVEHESAADETRVVIEHGARSGTTGSSCR